MTSGNNEIVLRPKDMETEASKKLVKDLGLGTDVIETTTHLNPVSKVSESEDDTDFSRENLRELITIGTRSSGDLYHLAQSSQNAKVYSALTEMIKATAQANRELLEVKKIAKEISNTTPEGESGPNTVNQNLIVTMTTTDLANMVKSLANGDSSVKP